MLNHNNIYLIFLTCRLCNRFWLSIIQWTLFNLYDDNNMIIITDFLYICVLSATMRSVYNTYNILLYTIFICVSVCFNGRPEINA